MFAKHEPNLILTRDIVEAAVVKASGEDDRASSYLVRLDDGTYRIGDAEFMEDTLRPYTNVTGPSDFGPPTEMAAADVTEADRLHADYLTWSTRRRDDWALAIIARLRRQLLRAEGERNTLNAEEPNEVVELVPTVGERLQAARERTGMTQAELAARVGLKQPNLAAIEKGRRGMSLVRLLDLCEALGVEPSEIDTRLRPK